MALNEKQILEKLNSRFVVGFFTQSDSLSLSPSSSLSFHPFLSSPLFFLSLYVLSSPPSSYNSISR